MGGFADRMTDPARMGGETVAQDDLNGRQANFRALICCQLILLLVLSAASLEDAHMIDISVHLNPALVLGLFFGNLLITGRILHSHLPTTLPERARVGHEGIWNVVASCVLAAATIFAVMPLFS